MGILKLGFTHSEIKETGRKAYNPVDMFKLYMYSYFNGIRSSRKIEKECHRNIEVMWLINELKPDFKTIADFRKDNKKQIKLAFSKFSFLCDELGLVSKEMVAVDGSKFRANNGRDRYHSKGKIAEKFKHYTQSSEKYLELLEQCDRQENDGKSTKINKEEIQKKLDVLNKRVKDLEKISAKVEKEGTIYETDPDSKMMKANNGGADISYNRTRVATCKESKFKK